MVQRWAVSTEHSHRCKVPPRGRTWHCGVSSPPPRSPLFAGAAASPSLHLFSPLVNMHAPRRSALSRPSPPSLSTSRSAAPSPPLSLLSPVCPSMFSNAHCRVVKFDPSAFLAFLFAVPGSTASRVRAATLGLLLGSTACYPVGMLMQFTDNVRNSAGMQTLPRTHLTTAGGSVDTNRYEEPDLASNAVAQLESQIASKNSTGQPDRSHDSGNAKRTWMSIFQRSTRHQDGEY